MDERLARPGAAGALKEHLQAVLLVIARLVGPCVQQHRGFDFDAILLREVQIGGDRVSTAVQRPCGVAIRPMLRIAPGVSEARLRNSSPRALSDSPMRRRKGLPHSSQRMEWNS